MEKKDWIEGVLSSGSAYVNAPKLADVVAAIRESKSPPDGVNPDDLETAKVSLHNKDWISIEGRRITLRVTRMSEEGFKLLYYFYEIVGIKRRKAETRLKVRYCWDSPLTLETVIEIFTAYFEGQADWIDKYTWGEVETPPPSLTEESTDGVHKEVINGKQKGVIYLLRAGPWWKIGKSTDSTKRMRQLKIQLPEKAVLVHEIETDDIDRLERHWHRYYSDKRGNGEWFLLDEPDISEFKAYRRIETE